MKYDKISTLSIIKSETSTNVRSITTEAITQVEVISNLRVQMNLGKQETYKVSTYSAYWPASMCL